VSQPEYNASDRRPIAARELVVFQKMAAWLADRGASPNGISVAGMIAALVGALALWGTSLDTPYARLLWLAGAVLTQLRLLANMLDGMVAIRRGMASPLGELYNEVPDRVSDTALLIGLGLASGGQVLLGFGAALAAVFTAYVRAMAKAAGAPQDFGGPMAKQQRMFLLTIVAIYQALAPAAWLPLWKIRGDVVGLPALVLAIVIVGSLWTALHRLLRAARFLRERKP
jgi:phosphatidylglycerophosphate synthase